MSKQKLKRNTEAPATTHRLARRTRQAQKKRMQRNRKIVLFAGAILIGIALLVVAFTVFDGTENNPGIVFADPTVGADSAPVQIMKFSDFNCPSCRNWHNSGIQEAIIEKYGDQVQFVWKDFPVISAQSPLAAEAGQCANAQGKFWDYHNYMYEHASGLARADLSRYAGAVSLDVAGFDACMDGGWAKAKVAENLQEARSFRLRGAPSFVVNGKVLPAPPSFAELDAIIQAALS